MKFILNFLKSIFSFGRKKRRQSNLVSRVVTDINHEDEDIKIDFELSPTLIEFTLKNKCDTPITLMWDGIYFIDVYGPEFDLKMRTRKLIHREMREEVDPISQHLLILESGKTIENCLMLDGMEAFATIKDAALPNNKINFLFPFIIKDMRVVYAFEFNIREMFGNKSGCYYIMKES